MQTSRPPSPLTLAEATAASLVSFLSFAIATAYFTDRVGLTISPVATLFIAGLAALGMLRWSCREASRGWIDGFAFVGIVGTVLVWLVRLAWPALLPPGGGADLVHHLQLVDYLDRHWRLVHDPAVEAYLGEMVHYTPGAHLLAALLGRWAGTDGFHAVYPLVAVSVSVKCGLVFLIARRLTASQPRGSESMSLPFALLAVVLLLFPRAFFIGSFVRYSYIAQVVSEMFAVAMWWAVVAWDEQRSTRAVAIFAIAGAGAFLSWPVWVGPPAAAFAAIVWLQQSMRAAERLKTIAAAWLPIAGVAAVHAAGRLGWAKIVRTDAATAIPALSDFSWIFLAFSLAGIIAAAMTRRGRATAILLAACLLQTAALFVLAKTNGANVPYMAIKMAYLVIYPLAASASLAAVAAWSAIARGRAFSPLAWVLVGVLAFLGVRQTIRVRLPAPAVSDPLYLAGRWARDHVDPPCVDYIVRANETAYWLHLAVVGNRRMSARTADETTFDTRAAIVRWIEPGGLPVAVADLNVVPKDVLSATDELARFDTAAVIKRRGASRCAP